MSAIDKVKHTISTSNKKNFVRFGICIFLVLLLIIVYRCDNQSRSTGFKSSHVIETASEDYDVSMPLIFVGGMPRSGTTLMRSMLDAHPEIRCGEETRIIPRILDMHNQMVNPIEKRRLSEAGISSKLLDSALQNFILEVITKHGTSAKYLCNKDPFILKSTLYLKQLFPNAKFIFMIRDGRAVVNSIITRKVKISGFNIKNHRNCLHNWNRVVKFMNSQCISAGPKTCMPVYYEQLVLHPEKWMHEILDFLKIPWNISVLHHQDFVGKPDGISLSRVEPSTDQVIKPVNIEALTKWVGQFPDDVIRDMASIAPMLKVFGYDPYANPPNYGQPDQNVKDNTLKIQKNQIFWKKKERESRYGPPK